MPSPAYVSAAVKAAYRKGYQKGQGAALSSALSLVLDKVDDLVIAAGRGTVPPWTKNVAIYLGNLRRNAAFAPSFETPNGQRISANLQKAIMMLNDAARTPNPRIVRSKATAARTYINNAQMMADNL